MTDVAPVNPLPVIVTVVPPVLVPWFGEIPVMVGVTPVFKTFDDEVEVTFKPVKKA